MRILTLGDVVSSIGCDALSKCLPNLLHDKKIDLCIANGENSADGNGMLEKNLKLLFFYGVDIITGGNHTYRRPEFYSYLDENEFIVRPANFPKDAPGKGICIYDMGRIKVAVISVMGVVYMEALRNPFETLDEYIEIAQNEGCKIILVDFHAEATAEKKAMGYYADGRVSAIFGTHTHVQTNDLQIFENGTGYITDLGMCGPKRSVLGIKPELAIRKMKTHLPVRFENSTGECEICGAIFDIDEKSGKCTAIELINMSVI